MQNKSMKKTFESKAIGEIDPSKAVHIAVHVQGQFLNPPAPRPSEEARQPEMDKVADRIDETAEAASNAGIPTLWSIKTGTAHMHMSEETMELYRVKPRENDKVIADIECSAVKRKEAQAFIKDKNVAFLDGGYTSVCMAETADDLLNDGYIVYVIKDNSVDFTTDPDWLPLQNAGKQGNRVKFITHDDFINALNPSETPSIETPNLEAETFNSEIA